MKKVFIILAVLLAVGVSGWFVWPTTTKSGCTEGGIKDGKCASSLVRLDRWSGALYFKEVVTRGDDQPDWVLQPPLCRPGEDMKYGANCTPQNAIVWGSFGEWQAPETSAVDRGGWTKDACVKAEIAFYTSPAGVRLNPSLSFSDMQKGVNRICEGKAYRFDACVAGVDRRFDNGQISHCRAQLQAIE